MGAFGGFYFTNKGKSLQAKAIAGAQLNFTRIAIGDGSMTGQQIADMAALINQKKSFAISKLQTQTGGKVVVGGKFDNSDIAVGFDFREIGIFATDPDEGEILYCYANAGATAGYIPAGSGGGPDVIEKFVEAVVIVGNAANVTATLDSVIYVTQQDLNAHTAATDAHGATSAATPSRIVLRDAAGRFKAANPAAADDVATKATVDAAIAALVNGAPGALDTLIELSNALGSDPNFATTMTNALATKLNASAYTAADVLAKLLTVDGVGSGLSADDLRGAIPDSNATNNTIVVRDAAGKIFAVGAGFTGTVDLPATSGGNAIKAGNGDAASYATHNFRLSGWWGMGMETYDGSVNGVYDFRLGRWDCKGGFAANGQEVWHAGNNGPGRVITLFASTNYCYASTGGATQESFNVNGSSGVGSLLWHEFYVDPALVQGRTVYFEAVIKVYPTGGTGAMGLYETNGTFIANVLTGSGTNQRVRSAALPNIAGKTVKCMFYSPAGAELQFTAMRLIIV